MNVFKIILDNYCSYLTTEFRETLASHTTKLDKTPIAESLKIGENENPVLCWQLLRMLLEWNGSGEVNILELNKLLFKLSQLNRQQCTELLAFPLVISEKNLKTSIFDMLCIMYLYIEYKETHCDFLAQIAEFTATRPEYFKLVAFLQGLTMRSKDEELIQFIDSKLEQDLSDPSLWNVVQFGISEQETPVYLYLHALLRNIDNDSLIQMGKRVVQRVEPKIWITPASTGETPLGHLITIVRCAPNNNEIVDLAKEIANKVDSAGWLIKTFSDEEETSPLFDLILGHLGNPKNEKIKDLLERVLERHDETEEGAVVASFYRILISLRRLLDTLLSNPNDKDIIASTRAEILLIPPAVWLVRCPGGTPIYLLFSLLLLNYHNEELISLTLDIVNLVKPGGWGVLISEDEVNKSTILYKLLEAFYYNPESKKLQELVLKAVKQTDSSDWAVIISKNETALHLLTSIFLKYHTLLPLLSIVKEVIPRTNSTLWGEPFLIKDNYVTTPLNALIEAFNKKPYNEEMFDIVESVSLHADIGAWTFLIANKFTPLHQLLGRILYQPHPHLIHIAKKLLERISPLAWELTSSRDKKFTVLSLVLLTLVHQPRNNTVMAMFKMAIQNALPSAWDIPITQDEEIVWDTSLRIMMRALSQNSQNEEIIERVSTLSKSVNPSLWREKNLSNSSVLYEMMLTLVNNSSNEQIMNIAKIAIENTKPEDWSVAILSDEQMEQPKRHKLNLLASVMPGFFIKVSNDDPGSTPLCALTVALVKNPKNEELIKLVEKVLKQLSFGVWNKIAKSGIGRGKSPFQRLLIALEKNPHHPILLQGTNSLINNRGCHYLGNYEKDLLVAALTPLNINYFIKTLIGLNISFQELMALNSTLFKEICSQALKALDQPNNQDENEKIVLDLIQSLSTQKDIWQFLMDKPVIEHSARVKFKKEKHTSSFLSRLLLLLEKPDLSKDSQKHIMDLLKNSTHPIALDSWMSLDENASPEFQQLKHLVGSCINLELKKQLEELQRVIIKKVAPESCAISTKQKKSIPSSHAAKCELSKEKTLWDLVVKMLEQPSKNNGAALVNYSSKKCWSETHIVTHPEVSNTWTPWLLLIIYSLDNHVAYNYQQMTNLLDTIGGLIINLPENAWTTPLLKNEHIIEYPMNALITIYKAIKDKPLQKNKSDEAIRQLLVNELKKIVETAIKHLYTKHPQVLDLKTFFNNSELNATELLLSCLPEIKKNNAPVFKKIVSENQQKLIHLASLSFFASHEVTGQVQIKPAEAEPCLLCKQG